jgi:hypothetical protein
MAKNPIFHKGLILDPAAISRNGQKRLVDESVIFFEV